MGNLSAGPENWLAKRSSAPRFWASRALARSRLLLRQGETERASQLATEALQIATVNDLRLVYLRGNRALLVQHLAARKHEFMPPELLDSQLDTLEPPAEDEYAIIADIDRSPPDIVTFVVNQLQTTGRH